MARLARAWNTFAAEASELHKDDPAAFLRDARASLGLGQVEMAARLGIHPTYLSKVERGRLVPGPQLLVAAYNLLEGK